MSKFNVLVTGVGAVIGYGIIKSLRASGRPLKIVGADIYAENYGRYLCDDFEQAPYTADDAYGAWLAEVIERHRIDIIFPGIEQDVFWLDRHRDEIRTKVVLNTEQLVRLGSDKYETFLFLKALGQVPVIPTFSGIDFETACREIGLPFIVKPRSSYASKGLHIIRSAADWTSVAHTLDEKILFQPVIGSSDGEYTVSVFGTGDGRYWDHLVLRRYLSAQGATEKAFVEQGAPALMSVLDALVAALKPIGPTNFQFREHHGEYYLLEVNPRISSACSLRTGFGYNEPEYCIDYFLNGKLDTPKPKKQGSAIRYIEDLIRYE
jgi:carbamoyl-phosphate synthase large subunit